MKLYVCDETNVIVEMPYRDALQLNENGIRFLSQPEEYGFCIVENFDYTYQKELPRFNKVAGVKPYGLPYKDTPSKRYLGIGNKSSPKDPDCFWEWDANLIQSEAEAIETRDVFCTWEHCDVVWLRVYESLAEVPESYTFYGYDITYTPSVEGAYSIINDCMFICKWHGCDKEGTAFLDYYGKLNKNGLFDDADTAHNYMKYYLSFDWSERGEYCICEIFRK